jgi:hypothetical protein
MVRAAVAFPELRKKSRRVNGSFHSAALVLNARDLSASVCVFIGSRGIEVQNAGKNLFLQEKESVKNDENPPKKALKLW